MARHLFRHKTIKLSYRVVFWLCVMTNVAAVGAVAWFGGPSAAADAAAESAPDLGEVTSPEVSAEVEQIFHPDRLAAAEAARRGWCASPSPSSGRGLSMSSNSDGNVGSRPTTT